MFKNHKNFLKNKLKYLKIFTFLIIGFFIISPVIVFANPTWVMPDPKIRIPGMKDLSNMTPVCSEDTGVCQMPWISEYKYAIGAVAILATVVMMIGGVVWITAAGSQTRIGEAKQWIGGALTGLVLVFSSYMILNIVNPDLVRFKPITIKKVDVLPSENGCCIYESVKSTSPLKTEMICKNITSKSTCTSYPKGKYTANAKCSGSVCVEIISDTDTGATGCCAYTFSGKTRCRNNYTEKLCEEKHGTAASYWDEGIDCIENSSCDEIDP